jgi:peroxiredoxin (alkyl hydroperoxide reductase subunit C)
MHAFIGKEAPNFTAATVMPDNSIKEDFNLAEYTKGQKCVLFFYPLDFTFVCPSEIIAFNNRLGKFSDRNTNVVAVSIDSQFSHLAWKNTPHSKGGIGGIQYPMVSDLNKNISNSYNVLTDGGVALRGTFLIDEDFILRHICVNDLPLGRDVDETLRLVDALSFHQQHGEVCPAGWTEGRDAMKESQEGVSDYLNSNADKL